MATHIAIVGSGTIGLSFAALHLTRQESRVTIYDPRPDLHEYVTNALPDYLTSTWPEPSTKVPLLADLLKTGRLVLSPDLDAAVADADIVQEQGPENIDFKQKIWPQIEAKAPAKALFWSSTSGIPASVQSRDMRDRSRLLVVHPFNPPHVMPLIEIVHEGASETKDTGDTGQPEDDSLKRTLDYWKQLGRDPVVLRQEATGFVANRLAFALLREAVYLVDRGVASVEDIDRVVVQSLGPRWAVRGPFWSYHAGGGRADATSGEPGGLTAFLNKIGGTVEACWKDAGQLTFSADETWRKTVCEQSDAAYGNLTTEQLQDRDAKLKGVLDVTGGKK